jgi:hypothetical protein
VTFELYNWRDDIETDQITNYADHLRMFPQNPNFIAETREIIASSGGTANLTVKAGAAHANKWYLVLSGISGCHPGFTMNGVKIPLNQDFWTMMAINFALGGIWTGFYTQLDANGDGTAVLNTFGPQAAAKGLVMYFDYIVLLNPTNSPIFASYPIYVMFR